MMMGLFWMYTCESAVLQPSFAPANHKTIPLTPFEKTRPAFDYTSSAARSMLPHILPMHTKIEILLQLMDLKMIPTLSLWWSSTRVMTYHGMWWPSNWTECRFCVHKSTQCHLVLYMYTVFNASTKTLRYTLLCIWVEGRYISVSSFSADQK